ncbi:MAG TPA: NAD+ synthase [Candidatus Acidoferrum sp.]|nr:NAD+ synthase [Candidatus Acidoferrum sp.]
MELHKTLDVCCRFTTGKLLESGLSGYVVGLSGGIDSALSAAIAVRALGAQKLLAVIMPYRLTPSRATEDAISLAKSLGVEYRVIDISPMIDAYFPVSDYALRLRIGNKMARERMSILFDLAQSMSHLVLGTSNRTEIALGYSTWYGDSACSVNPIGQLYKSDVRALAQFLDIPESIRTKAPSAELWHGQTDEGEIGVTYDVLDRLLERILDDGVTSMAMLEKEGFDRPQVSRVVSMINRTSYKRSQPAVVPLGRVPIPDRIQLAE